MDLAGISLAALVVTILVSQTTRVNPGFLAIVFAWIIAVYLAPLWEQPIGVDGLVAEFPAELFLTLVAVTLLFTQAQVNGTLQQVARAAVRCCRGNTGLVPIMFFLLALALSSIGAGSIAAAAIVAPMAMAVAERAGIPAFLMVVMVAHGAVAGGMSPFAPTGIIANDLLAEMGLSGLEWRTYVNNLLANVAVAVFGYLMFGGWRLFRGSYAVAHRTGTADPFEPRHLVTLAVIAALIVGVVFFDVHVGMGAFAGAVLLAVLRLADETAAVRAMPWGVILMVSGVTVLASLLEKTGGTDRFTALVSLIASEETVTGVIALLTGLISIYSSTSGVVLPAFLPIVPGLVQELGGGDPAAVASSMIIGSNLVDVSPLSTIGALCVTGVSSVADRRTLFNKVLLWGLSMALAGAAFCYVFFGMI